MSYILQSSIIFILCFACHVLWHRVFLHYHSKTLLVLLPYAIGLFIVCGLMILHIQLITIGDGMSLWFTSVIWYMILSSVMVALYIPEVLGGNTAPTDTLIRYLQRKPRTSSELSKLFSERNLIDKRIEDLDTNGFITIQSGKITLTPKGHIVAGIAVLVGAITGLSVGG